MQHRANRDGDELAAIVERHHLHARRQAAVGVERIDRRMHAADDVHRPFELLHEDDAEDHVGLVVAPRDPQPRRVADLNSRDVRQQDRHAVALREHRLLDIADRSDYADAAHVHGLLPERDRAAADVGVAHRKCADDLRQRQPVGHHLVEVDLGLILLGLAAERRDVGNARHDAQAPLHDPVFDGLELQQIHVGRPDELEAHDLAYAARRRDDRLHALRKGGVLQPIDGLLASKIVVDAVLELQPQKPERIDRVGAHVLQARRARERNLDRNGDVALHLLGRLARVLRDDLDDGRGRIGIGLDVERRRCRHAEAQERRERHEHQQPP